MNHFDIIILIILAVFGFEGFRRGLIREALNVVGLIIIICISFVLMNPLGNLFFEYLPLISLHLIGVEIQSLGILFYQLVAFILIAVVLYALLTFILNITGLLSKIMGLNMILRGPLKILGGVFGLITGYLFLFIALLILSVPFSNRYKAYDDSKLKDYIIDNKILFTPSVNKIRKSLDEVYDLTYRIEQDENRMKNSDIYNAQAIDILLKNKVVKIEVLDHLVENKKLTTYDKLNEVLDKYRKEKK